jgi:hypothetical protein
MAKKPISRITELAARIDRHLTQFEPMDDETDYSPVSRQEERKKRNPYVRAGLAGGTVAGAAAIAANKDRIKAGARDAMRRGGSAVASGMERTGAKVANAGIDAAGKLRKSKMLGKAGGALEEGAIKTGNKILKGAGKLKKLTGFEGKSLAGQLVRIERKLQEFAATEFDSPMSDYKKSNQQAAEKLRKESHILKGAGIGGLAGAAGGVALALRKHGKGLKGGRFRDHLKVGKGGYMDDALAKGVVGAGLGLGVGAEVGGRIRKKEK